MRLVRASGPHGRFQLLTVLVIAMLTGPVTETILQGLRKVLLSFYMLEACMCVCVCVRTCSFCLVHFKLDALLVVEIYLYSFCIPPPPPCRSLAFNLYVPPFITASPSLLLSQSLHVNMSFSSCLTVCVSPLAIAPTRYPSRVFYAIVAYLRVSGSRSYLCISIQVFFALKYQSLKDQCPSCPLAEQKKPHTNLLL